jgi:hypothetical protein
MDTSALIARIERYCAKHDLKETMFGFRAANDGKLMSRLRAGRTITVATLDLIEAQLKLPPQKSARDERVSPSDVA